MSLGVCLISAGLEAPSRFADLFEDCGLAVWTPTSDLASDGRIYESAVCLVIDMPKDAGLMTLKLFRSYGVRTPALLIVDPDCEVRAEDIDCGWIMDVIPRTANPLRVMRWIFSICATRHYLDNARPSDAPARSAA